PPEPSPITVTAPPPVVQGKQISAAPAVALAGPEGIAWTSPLPVAVGLVFFTIGSMIAIAADGRHAPMAPASAPLVVPSVTAAVTAPPPTTVEPARTAATASAPAAPAVSAITPWKTPSGAGPARPQPPPQPPPHKGSPSSQPQRPDLPFK